MNLSSNSFLHLLPWSEQCSQDSAHTGLVLCGLTLRASRPGLYSKACPRRKGCLPWDACGDSQPEVPLWLCSLESQEQDTSLIRDTHHTQGETQTDTGTEGGHFWWQVCLLCGHSDLNLRPLRPPGGSWRGQVSLERQK